jgi:tetratricopeptide (TPR) repeat protein
VLRNPIRVTRNRLLLLVPVIAVALFVTIAVAQDPAGRNVDREKMWPAATAEGWKKPCLVTWQRTWADALAISRETKKAILVCINMDGEIASEHYAGVRYRQPEIAVLYEPYVCVIASTYRHNPRDYDDQGRRILCPRFGSVTCGEHIAIEPILFEKFMDGKRIAPRHIMVELDGEETYDVMLTWDTASVFNAIRDGIVERTTKPVTIVRGDRSIVERVASPDIKDREAVEAAYAKGDKDARRALLEAASAQGPKVPLDILRQAVFGLDADMGKLARSTLAKSDSPAATDLIAETLRVPMDDAEREALLAALERIGKTLPRAQWLAVVNKGLAGRSKNLDAKAWAAARSEYEATARARSLGDLADRQANKAGAYKQAPDDAASCIELSEASLELAIKARKGVAIDPRMARIFARHLFEDARKMATRAAELDADAWRVNTILALTAYYGGGDKQTAYAHAEKAMKDLPAGEPSWNTMAVLTLFAESRWEAIKKVMDEKKRLPPQWLTDVNMTYAVLRHHPHGTDAQVVWHLDFLEWLRAWRQVPRILEEGIGRFPDSEILHRRLRRNVLRSKGIDALEPVYDKILAAHGASPRLQWYAAYASVVSAEYQRRVRKLDKALAAYGRAIASYERAVEGDPSLRGATDRRLALALAGRARVAYENEKDESALDDILAALARDPRSAGTRDGLGITPADTAQMLLARLVEAKRADLVEKLKAAIAKLDPELLPKD